MHIYYQRVPCNIHSFSLCRNVKFKKKLKIITFLLFLRAKKMSVTLSEKHFPNLIENRVLAEPFVLKPVAAIGA